MSKQRRRRAPRADVNPLDEWIPKTKLGRLVKDGHINSIEEILHNNYRIREPEIVDALFPDLKQEVVDVSMVQRQSDSGQQKSFRLTVIIGNGEGILGIGIGKAPEFVPAVRAAEARAKLNITMFRRGCGSWECRCHDPHSIPFEVDGTSGSVKVTLRPAPKGTGLVTADVGKIVL
ncbi:MAG: 30S ribosomal protein S5, partial [Candidatus Thorarchaeota archaeon]|nr:30S ribosomal protein S5 [Candidatus Thorarchaeota archaeon]